MPAVNNVGEPYAGEPHARFDGRGLETGHDNVSPRQPPTLHPWTVERRCGPQEKAHRRDGHRSAPGRESVPAHRAQPERPQASIAAEIAADTRRIAYGPASPVRSSEGQPTRA